eukprot:scaffold945_cov170-Amphora_coffeaeformis.AAC.9
MVVAIQQQVDMVCCWVTGPRNGSRSMALREEISEKKFPALPYYGTIIPYTTHTIHHMHLGSNHESGVTERWFWTAPTPTTDDNNNDLLLSFFASERANERTWKEAARLTCFVADHNHSNALTFIRYCETAFVLRDPWHRRTWSGRLTLSFFERRASRQLFGLVSHEERTNWLGNTRSLLVHLHCSWEQWVLRVVVNNTPRPISNDSAAVIERQRIQDTAEGMLRTVLLKIFEVAGESLDHIPPVMYDWACHTSTGQADDRENMYSRVSTMPPIFNLAN